VNLDAKAISAVVTLGRGVDGIALEETHNNYSKLDPMLYNLT